MPAKFRLAKMDALMIGFTVFCWALVIMFFLAAFADLKAAPIALAGIFMLLIYASVWFWWRPGSFEIDEGTLALKFPLRTISVKRADITACAAITPKELKNRFGNTYRVGAGGLWGGFGWLRTSKKSWIEFYISRQSDYVLIEREEQIPLLLTPTEPERFVEILNGN